MPIDHSIWRIECDPNGEEDPIFKVYLKRKVTVDGVDFEIEDRKSVPMKFSELSGLPDLLNVQKVLAKQATLPDIIAALPDTIAAAQVEVIKK